jgi:hypothetical protein
MNSKMGLSRDFIADFGQAKMESTSNLNLIQICKKMYIPIWYIFPVLVCCSQKNLATLLKSFHPKPESLHFKRQFSRQQA